MRHGVHQDKKCQDTGQKANPTNFQRDHRSHPGKRMQPDFSKIMLKIIGQRNEIFTCLKKIIFKPRILHSTNLSFRCEGKIKIVSHLQEILKILSPRTLSLSLSLRKLLEDELYLDEVINQQRGRDGTQEIDDPLQARRKGSSKVLDRGSLRQQQNSRPRKQPGQTAAGRQKAPERMLLSKNISDRLSALLAI